MQKHKVLELGTLKEQKQELSEGSDLQSCFLQSSNMTVGQPQSEEKRGFRFKMKGHQNLIEMLHRKKW